MPEKTEKIIAAETGKLGWMTSLGELAEMITVAAYDS